MLGSVHCYVTVTQKPMPGAGEFSSEQLAWFMEGCKPPVIGNGIGQRGLVREPLRAAKGARDDTLVGSHGVEAAQLPRVTGEGDQGHRANLGSVAGGDRVLACALHWLPWLVRPWFS